MPPVQIQLTIIGCGTLGRNIVDGLLRSVSLQPTKNYRLSLTTRNPQQLSGLQRDYPTALVTADNKDARIWQGSPPSPLHIVVIGTQPQYTASVCRDISEAYMSFHRSPHVPVVVTVCPGITMSQLAQELPPRAPIVRSMPNTPVAAGQGATALFANQWVDAKSMNQVDHVFRAISPTVEVLDREEMMDVVAAVSGSAPAYAFHLMRSLADAATARGIPAHAAQDLIVQSFLGAAMLARQCPPESLSKLLSDVCVPGGSTAKAMATLDNYRASEVVDQAVQASWVANQAMGDSWTRQNDGTDDPAKATHKI
ncbi:hypothetical protein AWENTII_008893 [Aspergillus wentii]